MAEALRNSTSTKTWRGHGGEKSSVDDSDPTRAPKNTSLITPINVSTVLKQDFCIEPLPSSDSESEYQSAQSDSDDAQDLGEDYNAIKNSDGIPDECSTSTMQPNEKLDSQQEELLSCDVQGNQRYNQQETNSNNDNSHRQDIYTEDGEYHYDGKLDTATETNDARSGIQNNKRIEPNALFLDLEGSAALVKPIDELKTCNEETHTTEAVKLEKEPADEGRKVISFVRLGRVFTGVGQVHDVGTRHHDDVRLQIDEPSELNPSTGYSSALEQAAKQSNSESMAKNQPSSSRPIPAPRKRLNQTLKPYIAPPRCNIKFDIYGQPITSLLETNFSADSIQGEIREKAQQIDGQLLNKGAHLQQEGGAQENAIRAPKETHFHGTGHQGYIKTPVNYEVFQHQRCPTFPERPEMQSSADNMPCNDKYKDIPPAYQQQKKECQMFYDSSFSTITTGKAEINQIKAMATLFHELDGAISENPFGSAQESSPSPNRYSETHNYRSKYGDQQQQPLNDRAWQGSRTDELRQSDLYHQSEFRKLDAMGSEQREIGLAQKETQYQTFGAIPKTSERMTSYTSLYTSLQPQPSDTMALTAVAYVAAPKSVQFLGICGGDSNQGRWICNTGEFKLHKNDSDFVIFKGIIPVPSILNSPFKFRFVEKSKQNFVFEGKNDSDNRNNELLPGSINYFILKPHKSESMLDKIWNMFKSSSTTKIAVELLRIANTHVLQEEADKWDTWFVSLQDALMKIEQELLEKKVVHEAYEKLFEEQRKTPSNYRDIIVLLTGFYILDYVPKNLTKLFGKEININAFSTCLLDVSSNVKIKSEFFKRMMEKFSPFNKIFSLLAHLQSGDMGDFPGVHHDMSSSLISFLNYPQQQGEKNEEMVSQAIGWLVRQFHDIDDLWRQIGPFFDVSSFKRSNNYKIFLDHLQSIVATDEQLIDVIKSDLMRTIAADQCSTAALRDFMENALKLEPELLSTIAKQLPGHLIKISAPIVEDNVLSRLGNRSQLMDEKTYQQFAKIDIDSFNNFPEARQLIETRLLNTTDQLLKQNLFHKVPSVRLIIACLSRREDIVYLDEPSLAQLRKVLNKQPREFFQGLDSSLQANGRTIEQTLKAQRSGRLNIEICNKIQQHYDYIEEIAESVRYGAVPLKEASNSTQDAAVRECLLRVGITESEMSKFVSSVETIRQRSELYSYLYHRLARLELASIAVETRSGVDDDSNQVSGMTYEIFYPHEWNSYLASVHAEKSTLSVKEALETAPPLEKEHAAWLGHVAKSRLFFNVVWIPLIQNNEPDNLSSSGLNQLIQSAAQDWYKLAQSFNEGKASFKQMEIALKYENDTNLLRTSHQLIERRQELRSIEEIFGSFRNISKIRHRISPFVAALRSFTLVNKKLIEDIHNFVQTQLISDWGDLSMTKLTDIGIVRTLYSELAIDKNPENIATMEFIASFVTTSDNKSPVIEWLRSKSEQDFEAMGKILQGHLYEAYGQLQTLKTRIAPYLNRTFETHQELLAAVQESEKRFARRHAGRVQEVSFEWLSQILPDIDTAIRASILSPSEEAKEKLGKLQSLKIDASDSEQFTIEVQLTDSKTAMSIEELKQAFQLLDMAACTAEDGTEQASVTRIRRNVELIVRLSQVYEALFNKGYIGYSSVWKQLEISMMYLECRLDEMRAKLNDWNAFWRDIAQLEYLSLFSRGILLYLAEAANRGDETAVLGFLRSALPLATEYVEHKVSTLVRGDNSATQTSPAGRRYGDEKHLLQLFSSLNDIVKEAFEAKRPVVQMPKASEPLRESLKAAFATGPIQILNIERASLVGTSLAAYACLTGQPVEPCRILFTTAGTSAEEVERFMRLWSVGKPQQDLFTIVHVERLSIAMAMTVSGAVGRLPPEARPRLLLVAQKHCNVQSTKSLGVRLGLASDRSLDVNCKPSTLRECFQNLSLATRNNAIHFFTSRYPGAGKSQMAMRLSERAAYHRIAVREGTVDELMKKLRGIDAEQQHQLTKGRAIFVHLDVGYSVSMEFNDILLSFVLHGALYDPRKAHLGYWRMNSCVKIGVEFPSPLSDKDFPIITFLGTNHECSCTADNFSYDVARMPTLIGGPIAIETSQELIVAAKFLDIKSRGTGGLSDWESMCCSGSAMAEEPLPLTKAFELLVNIFNGNENQYLPTFTSLMALATFIHRHVSAMIHSPWLNSSAAHFFPSPALAKQFKLDVFELLAKVANQSLARCWSLSKEQHHRGDTEFDWERRQRAMLLLGVDASGHATSIDIVGRCLSDLRNMFDTSLHSHLKNQSLQFQELNGVRKLLETKEGTETVLNALRSLLYLDGSPKCLEKARRLDNHPEGTPVIDRLNDLLGPDLGYALTGDNIMKMMFALYRVRCELPVIVLGETGVGKSALFRFLVETLLGHVLVVLNVNSGTSIENVTSKMREAVQLAASETRVFLFFDEMNTADPPVVALLKEIMLDRNLDGQHLPTNLHMIAAANPYRLLVKRDDGDASVGLTFQFTNSSTTSSTAAIKQHYNKDLVYRVNQLPRSFYDHIYDFGTLSQEAENIYIEEICQYAVKQEHRKNLKSIIDYLQKCQIAMRAMSGDPKSAVSLRDASRALDLFLWFERTEAGRALTGYSAPSADKWQVNIELAVYIAYAFRFTSKRDDFLVRVFGRCNRVCESVKQASLRITQLLNENASAATIGSGAFALNDALCENLLGLFVCVLNGIFVIIVGRPGTSKSLSVEILKLMLSPSNHQLRAKLGDLPALVERYFQCSPMSTSAGFEALFSSARKFSTDAKTVMTMVVLDELGLADLSPERPIKVLHAELERRTVLTSGETQQANYSVVALSNWVVDAAQVNRGILIKRRQANHKDLLRSAEELADSLVKKILIDKRSSASNTVKWLQANLRCIVDIYVELDSTEEIGGGHFYSMRDFFFCVKNYVCSILSDADSASSDSITYFNNQLIQSVFRNFSGHEMAKQNLRDSLQTFAYINKSTINTLPVVELINENIKDSCRALSVHIARHLMILNRSLIGLQLLNRHLKPRLENGIEWSVLFGSCFPDDLHVTSVTRKLRQVEQAIRRGGVIVLCHANQLFESLYMVLNQQYWAQGDVTMTQIALGPSIRAIALPSGPFRIIALQDTDVALNRHHMSPAVLSRFEKYEMRPRDLLNASGRELLTKLEAHPIWRAVSRVRWHNLVFGYHGDLLASLALQMQTAHLDEVESYTMANVAMMYASNPMAMIKFEMETAGESVVTKTIGPHYRNHFIFEDLYDALEHNKCRRIVIMTNSPRHQVDALYESNNIEKFSIQLYDIRSELEFDRILNDLDEKQLANSAFCLTVQYDATAGPIEQFQFAKYEIETRLENASCRVVFLVHVDPISVSNRWIFSFGDGWEYVFVDELNSGNKRISVKRLAQMPNDQPIVELIEQMSRDQFKNFLLEMLGPTLQVQLQKLGSNMGAFFRGLRTALSLPGSERLIELLKECLMAQLEDCQVTWNVLDAVRDQHFDSSTSLTEGLWEVFKQKVIKPLAHLLLITDVWRIVEPEDVDLWCQFLEGNYKDRLLLVSNSTTAPVEVPAGMQCCRKPFGRLLGQLDKRSPEQWDHQRSRLLRWLLDYIGGHLSEKILDEYFCDWMSLHITPNLQPLVSMLPITKMRKLARMLFSKTTRFVDEWFTSESKVTSALELVKLLSEASRDSTAIERSLDALNQINNWKVFVDSLMLRVFKMLQNTDMLRDRSTFVRIVTAIEISPAVQEIIQESNSLPELWIQLRITKQMYVFDPECDSRLYKLEDSSPDAIIEGLTNFVIDSMVRSHFPSTNSQRELRELLISTGSCQTLRDFIEVVRICPDSVMAPREGLLFMNTPIREGQRCPRCNRPLVLEDSTGGSLVHHLMPPEPAVLEPLFQKHQKFMLLLQQITEIYIEAKRNSPDEIRNLFNRLLSSNCTLRMSWRFFTVIVRCILKNRNGSETIDRLLTGIQSINSKNSDLPFNAVNFLRALVVCADEDVRNHPELLDPHEARWEDVIPVENWSVARVCRLAEIRRALAEGGTDIAVLALGEWAERVRNEASRQTLDAFLFFILRFASAEGDDLDLGAIFKHVQVPGELSDHEIVAQFKDNLVPMRLGFSLQPADGKAVRFQDCMTNGTPVDEVIANYGQLFSLERDWAPYIARLAAHASDIVRHKRIDYLATLTNDPGKAADLYLPGIENHPYHDSYTKGVGRWYVCSCETLCWVHDCGNVVMASICGGCGSSLAAAFHQPREGVRLATDQDFAPPRGIHMTRRPSTAPSYAARNSSPSVTRFALLLNCLCLLDASITSTLDNDTVQRLLRTLPVAERINRDDQQEGNATFLEILHQHVLVHLEFVSKLLTPKSLPRSEQFRFGHILLHRLSEFGDASLTNQTTDAFSASVQAREHFESALGRFLSGLPDISNELEWIDNEAETAIKSFHEAMRSNESNYWIYTKRTLSSRGNAQMALERNPSLKKRLIFLDMLLDDIVWARKLDGLVHLANGARFLALVRTSLQGKFTKVEADAMSIADGIAKVVEVLEGGPIVLGRGHSIRTEDQVMVLFQDFKQLWKKFSDIPNGQHRTFLNFFECQEIPEASRPGQDISENSPLILVLAGTNCLEMTFSCQLLVSAIEAANSVVDLDFIKPHCSSGTKSTRFNCSSAAGMASFDESLYAHVKRQDLDDFISDHAVIDESTLLLAEYYAMVAILGPTGSTIAECIVLDPFPDFIFKETDESENFLANLEQKFFAWQPAPLPSQIEDLILADLESNRLLVEAKSVLISVLTHMLSNIEPLLINQERNRQVLDVIHELLDQGVITNEHVSRNTQEALVRHAQLQVYQAMSLLKSVMRRMRGDDLFGGRIPSGWDEMLSERLIGETTGGLRQLADNEVAKTLNTIANVIRHNVTSGESVPDYYQPDKSLLQAIRGYLVEENWSGIPAEVRLANLGHVLLLAEQLA